MPILANELIRAILVITNGELFHIWQIHQKKKVHEITSIMVKFIEERSKKIFKEDKMKEKLLGFITTGKRKWTLCNRWRSYFEERESLWLKSCFNYLEQEDSVSKKYLNKTY